MEHLITLKIGIDAGHRVPDHKSKCKSIHGHRYEIEATCAGPLEVTGEQTGRVLDFGFLKNAMMEEIDAPCDHSMILWVNDVYVNAWCDHAQQNSAQDFLDVHGWAQCIGSLGKLYLIGTVPTAENLAYHWFGRLSPRVHDLSKGRARLVNIRVWETPNCASDYPGLSDNG